MTTCSSCTSVHIIKKCNLLWSFVDHKGNKQRVGLAIDADLCEIVGVYVGAQDDAAVRHLWDSLPLVYCQCAIANPDFWTVNAAVLPSKHHRAIGKETGKISYIERFNNILRQRVARRV